MPFAAKWMGLIILSELRERQISYDIIFKALKMIQMLIYKTEMDSQI